MIAQLGRYLHQSTSEVLEWEVDLFEAMHANIGPILESENSKAGPGE